MSDEEPRKRRTTTWVLWAAMLLVLYLLSIGPVAYIGTKAMLPAGYVRGTYSQHSSTGSFFFEQKSSFALAPSTFDGLPAFVKSIYAPVRWLALEADGISFLIQEYTSLWIGLAY